MDLHFEAITSINRVQAESLDLFPNQIGFIESVSECLEEADKVKEWKPVGIYDNNNLIGFAMYGRFPELKPLGQVWLDRFLIDSRYQDMGYGKSAIIALLNIIKTEYKCNKVYLSVYDDNEVAIELYKKIGFQFNGELDINGEKIMIYTF
ncbi:GNAT family N-acetyltransferase [Clostridium mediterraneense]|uniref:GNAT family N-acetyltransferase n=1 Tax=Clostridium mediterraneense TaxID=1805472 RepID=UPI0008315BC2|nr:GNAT family N-acetyltransferase [Clostridium mediterraneense]